MNPEFSFSDKTVAWATLLVSFAASVAGSVIFFRSVVDVFVPRQLQAYIINAVLRLFRVSSSSSSSSKTTTIFVEKLDDGYANEMYEAVDIYLGTKIRPSSNKRLRVTINGDAKTAKDLIRASLEEGETILDQFEEMEQLAWTRHSSEKKSGTEKGTKEVEPLKLPLFVLTFERKYKDRVLQSYFPHILGEADALKEKTKGLKLRSALSPHRSVDLLHPATFDTVAMDPDQKRALIADLDRFVARKDFYRRVGKAWKRGYLLYGPPGTGKSSLIAAIANYLNYCIYDLELSELYYNSDLRQMLLSTTSRSILVIEDIDCTAGVEDRNQVKRATVSTGQIYHLTKIVGSNKMSQFTLSALLNFIDGLWSSCGNERIVIFTTNYRERLDPALLRPGRMDMHVHMSYCTPAAFRILANNYLGIQDHDLFRQIEALIQEVNVTPATIAGELMRHNKPDVCLARLLEILRRKKLKEIQKAAEEAENGKKTTKQKKREETEDTETESETETDSE